MRLTDAFAWLGLLLNGRFFKNELRYVTVKAELFNEAVFEQRCLQDEEIGIDDYRIVVFLENEDSLFEVHEW